MAIGIWVNIGSGHGLIPDGTQILPELILISEVMWHPPASVYTANAQATVLYNQFKNWTFEITATYPMGKWINEASRLVDIITDATIVIPCKNCKG